MRAREAAEMRWVSPIVPFWNAGASMSVKPAGAAGCGCPHSPWPQAAALDPVELPVLAAQVAHQGLMLEPAAGRLARDVLGGVEMALAVDLLAHPLEQRR